MTEDMLKEELSKYGLIFHLTRFKTTAVLKFEDAACAAIADHDMSPGKINSGR
jgi:hypothetical protein